MKLKLDENLPAALVSGLGVLGFDVDTVLAEGLEGKPDTDVWAGAQSDGRFLLTQDLDFSDIRRFIPGTHAGCAIFRLGNPGRLALLRRVTEVMAMHEASSWSGCVIIATDLKVRVRRP